METQAAQVKAEDFGIIAELHEVLAERDVMLDSNQIRYDAEEALRPVQEGVRPLGPGDPLTYANSALDGISTIPSTPENVTHPDPIRLLIGDENPASVDMVWDTILNLPTYTIWSRYQARGSSITQESFDEADWG